MIDKFTKIIYYRAIRNRENRVLLRRAERRGSRERNLRPAINHKTKRRRRQWQRKQGY